MSEKNAILMATVLTMFGTHHLNGNQPLESRPIVVVQLIGSDVLSLPLQAGTKTVVEQIMAEAGVDLRWEYLKSEKQASRCASNPAGVRSISVRFSVRTPPMLYKEAFATAFPFAESGVDIVVLYDHLLPGLQKTSRPEILLGHVLAHELGHTLMRTDSHAKTGVMKANWSAADLREMKMENLRFEPRHLPQVLNGAAQSCAPELMTRVRKR